MVNKERGSGDPANWTARVRLLIALAVVFAIKAVVLIELKDHPLLAPDAGLDTTAYVQLAQQVLAGNIGLGPGLYYVSPFYIYFLAALLAIAHSFTFVRVVQIVLGTLAVGGVWVMAREWFGERAAWYATALAGLTGLFTFFEVLILQSSIDVFLTSAALCALTLALTRRRNALFAVSGIVFGLTTLNRPNILLAAGALVAALAVRGWLARGKSAAVRLRPAALLFAGIVAGMAPAAIRNVVVSHEFTFVSSHGGLNFYIGNNPRATGYYQPVPGINPTIGGQQTDTIRVASQALGHPATDEEASAYFFNLSWTWIAHDPAAAAWLFIKKVYFVFNAGFTALPQSYPFFVHDERTLLRFLIVGPWLLIPLGLVGLIFGSRRTDSALPFTPSPSRHAKRPASRHIATEKGTREEGQPIRVSAAEYLVWVTFAPAYAVAVAVFFVAERYRLPLLVVLAIGAGAAIDLVVESIRTRATTRLARTAAVLVIAAIAANWRLHLDDGRWVEGLRLAQRLLVLGRTTEAEQVIPRIEPREPTPGATDFGVASEALQLNQPNVALPLLQRAEALAPSDPHTDYALGQALLQLGRANDALPHLRHGFESGIEVPQGGYDYAVALRDTGDVPGAFAVLRRINPGNDPEAWLRLGRFAVEAKAPDVAEPFFRRAVQLQPDAASRQQFGLDLMLLGKYDEAARELGEAARLDPRDAGTLSHLAYCEMKLGHLDAARTHVAQALASDPNEPLARQLAAVLR